MWINRTTLIAVDLADARRALGEIVGRGVDDEVTCRGLCPILHRRMIEPRAHFPLLVVGAGHAGCEAACIAAKMGVEVGLVTMSFRFGGPHAVQSGDRRSR